MTWHTSGHTPQQPLFHESQPLTDFYTPPCLLSGLATEDTKLLPYVYTQSEKVILSSIDPQFFYVGPTPVRLSNLWDLLTDHSNPGYVAYMLQGFSEEFSYNFKGPFESLELENLHLVNLAPHKIDENIGEELQLQHLSGPFSVLPNPLAGVSPIGQVPKKGSSKVWTIFHLSVAPPGHMSVKEGIDPDKFHRKLEGISTAIAWMRYLGPDCWLFKVDIRSAYRHCSIRLLDQLFHVFCWHNEYYVDHNLSFGFCTAPAIWNRFANLICWIANQRLDPSTAKIAHYVDKFYGIVRGSQVVADSVFFGFLTLLSFLGVLILDEKLIHPTKAMTLVGFNLNSTSIFVKIPPEHIASFVNELEAWLGKDRCFLNELQSLVGWMIWCGQVIPHACTFTQHSISHLHPTRKGGCIWHVSLEMKQEFLWWICAVQYWPGLDIFADRLWYEPSLSHFYTDLTLWAGGATFLDYLTFIPWPLHLGTSIQALELATILVALYTFAPMMKGSRLICFTDNNANVKALEKGASENTVVHAIIQEIYWAHLQLQTQVRLVFIPGRTNIIADKISRCTSAAEAALAFPHLQFLESQSAQQS